MDAVDPFAEAASITERCNNSRNLPQEWREQKYWLRTAIAEVRASCISGDLTNQPAGSQEVAHA